MMVSRLLRTRRRWLVVLLLLAALALLVGHRISGLGLAVGLGVVLALGYLFARDLRCLDRSEQRLHDLFHNSPTPTAITRLADGTVLEVNDAFLEMIGYARAEVIGRTTVQIGLWANSELRAARIQELRQKGRVLARQAAFQKKSGQLAHAVCSVQLMEFEGEQRALVMMQEISEQHSARQALEQLSERLLLATRAAQAGIWDWDFEQGVLTWDEQMYRLYGLDPEVWPDRKRAWARVVHPEDRARVESERSAAAGNGVPYSVEFRIIRPDGVLRHIRSYGTVNVSADRRPTRLTGINLDITERKQAEEELRASKERFRRLVETTHVVPWTADPSERRFTYVGPQVDRIAGYPSEQWCVPGFWRSKLHPEERERVLEICRRELALGREHELEYRFLADNGDYRWLRELVSVVNWPDGHRTLQGFLLDITEARRAEGELKLAAKVFGSSGEAIVITDARARVLTVNPAYTVITGYSETEAVGRSLHELSHRGRNLERHREIWDLVERNGYWQGEVWGQRKSGERFPTWLTVSIVRDSEGKPVNYIQIFSDITERKEREERVRHLAHHDALTDLPNRLLLNDRLAQAIAHAVRDGTRVAVMFLDLDRFKTINDSLGHSVGDKLLQHVARRLRGCVRASDTVSRLGGDEFVILAPDLEDVASAASLADKVLQAVARPCSIDGHELALTPSIGISVCPGDGEDVDALLRNADAAMYHAKESGRNNYQFFTQDMNARAMERLSLERSLRRALEGDELRLHYQPQYDIGSGRLVGMEALIRWQHPEEGLVAPARFMPYAEESGLILAIGEWVLQTACRQNRRWQADGLPKVPVSVNISALQFRQLNFVDTVQRALSDSGLDSTLLELEATESVIMYDAERVTDALQRLKAMGLTLAIDDFGTGYSSLSYLKRFPIDRVKIDRSFVRDVTVDKDDAAIISAIIALTRNLGLRTIAEGVETEEQLAFLRAQDCDEVQGFLLGKPLPPAECAQLLAREAPVPFRHIA